jgi:hemolysin III
VNLGFFGRLVGKSLMPGRSQVAEIGIAPDLCCAGAGFDGARLADSSRPNPRPICLAETPEAEIANSITHGLGFVLSVAAAAVLIPAAWRADLWQFIACAIYATTMIAVYAASTASHLVQRPRIKQLFRVLDQGFIYLFIAGSFTPIAAAFLRGGQWTILLTAIWTIAAAGFASKIFFSHRIDSASVVIPLVLGWLPVTGGRALLELVPAPVLWWMLAGGLCYSAGTLFLMQDHRHRHLHAMWHLWVIAGTACQFWAILHYTLPAV